MKGESNEQLYYLEIRDHVICFWTGKCSLYTAKKSEAKKIKESEKPNWFSDLFHKLTPCST
jgi:hypothetical protein